MMRIIVVVALVLGCVSGITGAVSAADGGTISGFVYQDDNVTAIEGAAVYAKDYDADPQMVFAYSAVDGSYTISGLGAGNYWVMAEAETYLREWYDNASDSASATEVPVTAEAGATGINFSLTPGGSISGLVQEQDGTRIPGAYVVAYDNVSGLKVDSAFTDNVGSYSLAMGLYSGYYRVKAEARGYLTEYHDNVTDWASATPVLVTVPNDTPISPFVLMPGGSISGTVYESDNVTPINGALVSACDNATQTLVDDELTGYFTSASGTYTLSTNIFPASYLIKVEADGYVTQYWELVTDNASATLITITGTENIAGVNFSLQNIAPRVSTSDADNVTFTSARLNGDLTSKGTADNVTVSFKWGTTAGGPYPNETDNQTLSDLGPFSFDLGSLHPGVTYYYVAKAVGDDAAYGDEKSFTTLITSPSVTTNAATLVTITSARMNATLTSLGTADNVTVWFVGGTVQGGPYDAPVGSQVLSDTEDFYFDATGLAPGTAYYYVAVADGDGDPVYGDEQSATTLTEAPTVTTGDATNVATTSATLNGDLTSLGTAASVSVSFEWGIATGSYTQTTASQGLTGAGAFSADLSGLTPETTYYYRTKAAGDSTVYGAEKTFTASTTPPTVTTSAASSLAATSATLNGNLDSLGTATSVTVTFEWGTTTSYGSETSAQSVTAIGGFSASLTGLTADTTYHFRAKAVGYGSAVYGEDMTFTTPSLADTAAPVISAVNSSNITTSGATITWTTNEAATSQVEYGLTEEYGLTTPLDTNLMTGHSVDLTGLKAGKTYHYRVISKDAPDNQAVSADNTFTTAARSGGMPVWAWVIIALAVVAVLGAAAYLIRGRLAQG